MSRNVPVVANSPDGGVQLAIMKPIQAQDTVKRENVAVTRVHEMPRPEHHFKAVVNIDAKNVSNGSSASTLAIKYS